MIIIVAELLDCKLLRLHILDTLTLELGLGSVLICLLLFNFEELWNII